MLPWVGRDGTESLTSGRELRVHPLAHNPLQPHTRAHEPDRNKSQCIRPRRVPTDLRNAPLSTLPRRQCGRHREQCLDEGSKEEPCARFGTHLVADTPNGGAGDEGEDGGEGLLIR